MWYCTTIEKTGEKSSDAFPLTCFRRFVLRFIFAERVSSDKFELTFFLQAAFLLWVKSSDLPALLKSESPHFVMMQLKRVIWLAAQNLSRWIQLARVGTTPVCAFIWTYCAPIPLQYIHEMISHPQLVSHLCCHLAFLVLMVNQTSALNSCSSCQIVLQLHEWSSPVSHTALQNIGSAQRRW